MNTDLKVYFDGIELTKYIDVLTEPDRSPFPEIENKSIEIGKSDGSISLNKRYKNRTISFEFIIQDGQLKKVKDELAIFLNKPNPAPLIFSDEPERYWLAKLDSTSEMKRDEYNSKVATGKFVFLCDYPFAQSINENEFTNNDGALTEIKVKSEGTYKSFPAIEAKMKSDNGLLAFISSDGSLLQFGSQDEVDGVDVTHSDNLIHDLSLTQSNVQKQGYKENDVTFNGKFLGKYDLDVTGKLAYKSITTDHHIDLVGVNDFGTGTQYHGPSLSKDIPEDANGHVGAESFDFRARPYFLTGQLNQTGMLLFEIRDTNGDQLCSLNFYKNNTTNNKAYIRMNYLNQVVAEKEIEANNANVLTAKFNEFLIRKMGNKIEWHLGGLNNGGFIKTIEDDALIGREAKTIVIYYGVFGNQYKAMEMDIASITFQKHNVTTWEDIPNRFSVDDVVKIDTRSGLVEVNGREVNGLGAHGNDLETFYVGNGESTIRCIVSDWADMPEVTVKVRDVYL